MMSMNFFHHLPRAIFSVRINGLRIHGWLPKGLRLRSGPQIARWFCWQGSQQHHAAWRLFKNAGLLNRLQWWLKITMIQLKLIYLTRWSSAANYTKYEKQKKHCLNHRDARMPFHNPGDHLGNAAMACCLTVQNRRFQRRGQGNDLHKILDTLILWVIQSLVQ